MPVIREPVEDGKLHPKRPEHVTASNVAATVGVHPYCSALRLYMEKRGIELPAPASAVLRRGKLLESSVAAAVAEQRPDWRLEKCSEYFYDPDLRLGATPDYFVHGDARGLGVLQCKTVAPSVFKREWTADNPPFWIVLQNLTELLLTDAAFGVVAALVVDPFNLECPLYEVARHAGAEQRIRDAVARFWQDLAAGREPDADYGLDRELLPLLWPKETAEQVADLRFDNAIVSGLIERADLKEQISKAEARCKQIETLLMARMGEAERALVPDFSITWKTQHRPQYTVPEKNLRILRIIDKRRDEEAA
jgi:predicted phage-related endonuclease